MKEGVSAPEGWLGERRGSQAQRAPPTVRGSTGIGRDATEGRGLEENMASVSPAHLVPGEPAEVEGLILCPLTLPPATLNLSP